MGPSPEIPTRLDLALRRTRPKSFGLDCSSRKHHEAGRTAPSTLLSRTAGVGKGSLACGRLSEKSRMCGHNPRQGLQTSPYLVAGGLELDRTRWRDSANRGR